MEVAMNAPGEAPKAGHLNAAIANEIGRIVADFTGRGPTKSRAFLHQDVVVCLLEDSMTKAERNLVAAGKEDIVRQLRDTSQRGMETELVAAVEKLTDQSVISFLSGTATQGDASAEIFVLEPTRTG
jgi:uncharacterized protein YbcI